jgi:Bifunctional DNA primase/polymerase, N-terminal/Primase C terminal 1 (PriCT-1)
MSSTTKLDAVLELAKRSWNLFPQHSVVNGGCTCGDSKCEHVAKHSTIRKGWNTKATGATKQLTEWWTASPSANIGVKTGLVSYLMVIDVDGATGAESLRALEEKYGPLPATLTSKTGRGQHYFFKHPGHKFTIKLSLKACAKRLGPGLEIKADGKADCVTVPPSVHASGKSYEWLDAETPVANAPNWLLDLLTVEDVPTPASDSDVTPEGQRNDAMYAKVCDLFKTGASKDAVLLSALEINQRKCQPPLPDAEIRSMVASVARTHKPKDGSAKAPKHVRNPFHWFAFDTVEHLADQHALTDYQQGWRMNLLAYAWQGKGYLVNDPHVLFKLSNATSKKRFKGELHKALHDFEQVEKDGLPHLVNQRMADQFAEKADALEQKKEAGRKSSIARAQEAALAEKQKREAIPTEKKAEAAA